MAASEELFIGNFSESLNPCHADYSEVGIQIEHTRVCIHSL